MATNTNDLETLRAESQLLGSRITRLSVILISALIVVTFTITNGLEKVDVREARRELDAAETSSEIQRTAYQNRVSESQNTQSGAALNDEEKKHLLDLWFKALDKQHEALGKYLALLKEQFSINPSLLGSGLKIDLRSWIYSIPFVVLVTFLYIQILRKKQKTLSFIGTFQLSDSETTKLDRLTFSELPGLETVYAKSPSQLEHAIYLIIVVFLISVLVVVLTDTDVDFLGLSFLETLQYLLMFFTAGFYAASYYYSISISLDEQAMAVTGEAAEPGFLVKSCRKLQAGARRITGRLKPRISLTTGALLILASLFLSTSASCDGSQAIPLPGHKLLQDQGGGSWVSAILTTSQWGLYWQNSIRSIGRDVYALSLVLAVLSLLVVLCSLGRQRLYGIKTVHAVLFLASMTLSLIVITDFSFSAFWFKDELFLLSNLFWLVPAALLCGMTLSKTGAQRKKTKAFLVALLLPLVVNASVYVCYVALQGFRGVLVYFVGLNLLSFTYLELARADLRNAQVDLQSSSKQSDHTFPSSSSS